MPRLEAADRHYLQGVVLLAFGLRMSLLILLWLTDATYKLRLSPDSEKYHAFGIRIAQEMERGFFNWPNWIDNGWFQFNGLVYWLFGPQQWIIQLLNVSFGSLTVLVVYHLALEVSRTASPARISALMVAIFPSFIFWSCMAIKDPIAILSMSLLVLATVKLRHAFQLRWILVMVLCLVIFLGIREYMFFVGIGLIVFSLLLFTPRALPRAGTWLGLAALALVPMAMGFGAFGYEYFSTSMYLDVDYINHVRVDMGDHGTGAIYDHDNVALWGGPSLLDDVAIFLKGVLFFFVTLNLTEINSARQVLALPEVIFVILLLPHLARGMHWLWLDRRNSFPLLVFIFGIMVMLISATTNLGALFRWRMQIMPLLVIAMAIGVFYMRAGPLYRLARKLTREQL
jgi:hypothetical protein